MLKLLIVSKQRKMGDIILNSINWNAVYTDLCSIIADKQHVLKFLEDTVPDIVIMDMRMPEETEDENVDFIATIAKMRPSIKIIAVDTCENFIKLQKAVHAGASEYLMIPFTLERFLRVVLKFYNFDDRSAMQYTHDFYQTELLSNLPVIKEKYLSMMLRGELTDESIINDKLSFVKPNVLNMRYCVCVIRVEQTSFSCFAKDFKEIETRKYAVKNIVHESLLGSCNYDLVEFDNDLVLLVGAESIDACYKWMCQVASAINDNLWFHIRVSVSQTFDKMADMNLAYSQAVDTLGNDFLTDRSSVIKFTEQPPAEDEKYDYPLNLERAIVNSIKTGAKEDLSNALDSFFTYLESKKTKRSVFINYCLCLYNTIYHISLESRLSIDEYLSSHDISLYHIMNCTNAADIHHKLYGLMSVIYDKLNKKLTVEENIKNAVLYINKNYNKNITLEDVASHIFITPSYLSMLFKKVLNINFLNYLHRIRIEHACELLKSSNLKTYEIARMVGYTDEKYFSQVFKKYMGTPPSSYKRSVNVQLL